MRRFFVSLGSLVLASSVGAADINTPAADDEEDVEVTLEPEPGLPSSSPRATRKQQKRARARASSRETSLSGPEAYLGPTWPLSSTVGGHPTMLSLGVGYVWDVRQILLEARADFGIALGDNKLIDLTGTFGAHYVWWENDYFGVYSGLGFGVGMITGSVDGAVGSLSGTKGAFVLAADTGFLVLRGADISMDVRLRGKLYTSSYGGSLPLLFSILVGLHW